MKRSSSLQVYFNSKLIDKIIGIISVILSVYIDGIFPMNDLLVIQKPLPMNDFILKKRTGKILI